jgi:hypothetical protein
MKTSIVVSLFCLFLVASAQSAWAAESATELAKILGANERGEVHWRASAVVQAPAEREDRCFSVKDPTVVRYEERWHLFTTIRSEKRSHQIEYSSFRDWSEANKAERHLLRFNPGYFCAPQVFWFSPQRKWYLLHQANDPTRPVTLQPAFSTSTNISDPGSWSAPEFLYRKHPNTVKGWIDFWMICDERWAHLFFTSNNGLMWRAETKLEAFPQGWTEPQVVLRDDIFEASHTYRIGGGEGYLTIVEAQDGIRRYYKAYAAKALDGEWKALFATREKPFTAVSNVRFEGVRWAESISHGELIRSGYDERLEIDPKQLKFLFQGARDQEMKGVPYGSIPWRLGLLELEREGE